MRRSPAHGAKAWSVEPLSGTLTLRVLGVATLVGVFISLFGPFGRGFGAYLAVAACNLVFSWTGSLLGLIAVREVGYRLGRGVWTTGLAAGLAMAPAQGLIVWAGVSLLNGRGLPASAAPELFWRTLLICIASCFAAVLITQRLRVTAVPAPVKFLERLPLKLRGAEVWAVEAEDHYLRLHTSKGQDLILLRLADAVAELQGVEGAQVHRSWWVARDAITEARKGDGRATLTLKDGAEVPVSRTYAGALRQRGWI